MRQRRNSKRAWRRRAERAETQIAYADGVLDDKGAPWGEWNNVIGDDLMFTVGGRVGFLPPYDGRPNPPHSQRNLLFPRSPHAAPSEAAQERFVFDRTAALAALEERFVHDADGELVDDHGGNPPHLWLESPARSIEEIFADLTGHVDHPGHLSRPAGCDILVYPLVYESDPDGLVVAVTRSGRAALMSYSMDWDDIAEREQADRDLTPAEAVAIVDEIVRYANELLDQEAQR
jgi:hypothetical protein